MNSPRRRGFALIAVSVSRGSPDAKLAILAYISPRGVGLASVMVGSANSRLPALTADQSGSCSGGLTDPITKPARYAGDTSRGGDWDLAMPPRVSTGPVVSRA